MNKIKQSALRISKGYIHIRDSKISLNWVPLIVACLWFFWVVQNKTSISRQLKTEGLKIKGVVSSKYKVGAKGTIRIEYKFFLNGTIYRGSSDNEKHQVSDSLYILYLKHNPNINQPL